MSKKLEAELQKTRPFESAAEAATVNVQRTGWYVQSVKTDFFQAAGGITLQQYNVLRILRGTGPQGWPSLEIGHRMVQKLPDVSRLLGRMETAGLVKRVCAKDDRRVKRVTLTTKGRRLVNQLDEPLADFHEQLMSGLTISEQVELNRLLDKVRE